jgi:hypothetical protein
MEEIGVRRKEIGGVAIQTLSLSVMYLNKPGYVDGFSC